MLEQNGGWEEQQIGSGLWEFAEAMVLWLVIYLEQHCYRPRADFHIHSEMHGAKSFAAKERHPHREQALDSRVSLQHLVLQPCLLGIGC